MLWSKSIVDADSLCHSQSIKLRLGESGGSWGGYAVGSHVHNVIESLITGDDPPSSDHLSVMELVAAERLGSNFKEMEIRIPDEGSRCEHSFVVKINEDGSVTTRDTPDWAIRGEDWDPARAAGEPSSGSSPTSSLLRRMGPLSSMTGRQPGACPPIQS